VDLRSSWRVVARFGDCGAAPAGLCAFESPAGSAPPVRGSAPGTRPSRCPPREPVACSLPAVVAGSGCRCYHTEHFPAAATYSLQRARPRSLKERKCDGWEVVMDTTVGPEVFNDGGTSDDTDIKSVGGGDAQPKWNA